MGCGWNDGANCKFLSLDALIYCSVIVILSIASSFQTTKLLQLDNELAAVFKLLREEVCSQSETCGFPEPALPGFPA